MAESVPFLKSVNTERVWNDEKDNSTDRNSAPTGLLEIGKK